MGAASGCWSTPTLRRFPVRLSKSKWGGGLAPPPHRTGWPRERSATHLSRSANAQESDNVGFDRWTGYAAGNQHAESGSTQRGPVRLLRRWEWSFDADYLRLAPFGVTEGLQASGLSRTRDATSSISSPVSAFLRKTVLKPISRNSRTL